VNGNALLINHDEVNDARWFSEEEVRDGEIKDDVKALVLLAFERNKQLRI
jgi:NADH pyrophosphatase NudC (nudix superfamily)